ncbi:MAG: 4'-phosphopantetheinyl transferase superfamily protein [Saccharofermentans sp.]|nr:4'-phosphopantetheinyl transferase superfamily protein [Saccharofermentans sp.]
MEILIADSRQLPLEAIYKPILCSLPEEDILRSERYVRQEDRIRCAVGAFIVRYEAERVLHTKEFHIERTEFGKPYIKEYPEMHFSLSHSGNMIVYVQASKSVGIDVEEIKNIEIPDYTHCLNENEKRHIKNSQDPIKDFYRIWTVREAFAKKEGLGLPMYESETVMTDIDNGTILFRNEQSSIKTFEIANHILSVSISGKMPELQLKFIDKINSELQLIFR